MVDLGASTLPQLAERRTILGELYPLGRWFESDKSHLLHDVRFNTQTYQNIRYLIFFLHRFFLGDLILHSLCIKIINHDYEWYMHF